MVVIIVSNCKWARNVRCSSVPYNLFTDCSFEIVHNHSMFKEEVFD